MLLLLQHFAEDVRSSQTEQSSLTTPVSENRCTNEPRRIHDIPLPLIQSDKCKITLTLEVPQDKIYIHPLNGFISPWRSCDVVISSDPPVVSSSICFQTLKLVPVWPIGDGGCPSNLYNGMYSRSSGENVFRAFISTSSDWLPLQLHMLALALQHPFLVTEHFDWSMNSS